MKKDKVTQLNEEIEGSTSQGTILNSDISEEMQRSYLDYAMSVIVSRALPDVRDGLKPVHRRIIYSMAEKGYNSTSNFKKCATVVGDVMGRYHPHGDSSIYEALVRMGQPFSLRYTFINPQGNFGNIDGDPAAAMRYTECKLTKLAEELYRDIDSDTIDFVLNDLQNYEPTALPSAIPNLIINGAVGIAVGMATNIPPHNLGEIIDGISLLIDTAEKIGTPPVKDAVGKEILIYEGKVPSVFAQVAATEFVSKATVEDLIKYVKGPDFPTGGIIYDQKELMQVYATGRGRVVTRARTQIEEVKGQTRIIVSEIPYQVVKATLISKIADLVKEKKIEGISNLRDESNKQGMRIVIELKRDAIAKKVENQLFKYTALQSTFNANIVALVNNEPRLLTLKMILEEFIKHRQSVVVRRTLFLYKKAKEREHILIGLKKALDILDEVIAHIRASKDAETAKAGLITKFGFSEIQAQAILDMQLRKLAALERKKIEEELAEILNTIKSFETLLASPEKIIKTVKDELLSLKEKYGDERKTKVIKGKIGEFSEEDLITEETCIITISKTGYIKRLKEDTYKKQSRGGKGVIGQTLKDEDEIFYIRTCNTHDHALFFTNTGKAYKLRIWEIPEASRTAKGTAIVNFLSLTQDEKIQSFITLDTTQMESSDYIVLTTQEGQIKKTSLQEFQNIRTSGIIAIKLGKKDSLVQAKLSSGKDDILLTTAQGQSIRFDESDARPMGRNAGGVTGIRVTQGDYVVGTVVITPQGKKGDLVVVTANGYGKKTAFSEYKTQGRGGSGIITYKITDKTGELVFAQARPEANEGDILLATSSGKIIRLALKDIPQIGRNTQGVRLIKLSAGDYVTSVTILEEKEADESSEE